MKRKINQVINKMVHSTLSWVTFLSFLFAVYYTLKLVRETKYEKYWIFFSISAFFMGMHHVAGISHHMGLIDEHALRVLEDVGEIVGSLALAYAAYGLSESMRNVRKRFTEE